MTTPEWGTINEAAAHWHVHRDTIDRWVRQGKVKWTTMPSGRKLILLTNPKNDRVNEILASVRKKDAATQNPK